MVLGGMPAEARAEELPEELPELQGNISIYKYNYDTDMDEPVDTDKDGNSLTLMDLLDDGTDIHEQVDMLIRSRQLYRFLGKCLDKREFDIIVYRYGLYGNQPHTQNETAEKLDISRSYVSRIEKKAIEKLRKMYESSPM